VHLDLPRDDATTLPLPVSYPVPEPLSDSEKDAWMRELVKWWQLDRSQLDHRIPYIHGGRLRRFGGKIDQVARIIRLLRHGSTTRALAVLIDPFRDFVSDGREEFASFCLVESKPSIASRFTAHRNLPAGGPSMWPNCAPCKGRLDASWAWCRDGSQQ
jgi:hypothetical protein